jgi:hypothetical protein
VTISDARQQKRDLQKKSWLVQRLNRPPKSSIMGLADNPFSFGGGLRNGGLSPEAMDLLRPIFSFDYMGAAEFEFGAVPQALQGMAGEDLVATKIEIPLAEVIKPWDFVGEVPAGDATIYLLTPKEVVDATVERVRDWASGRPNLKEGLFLDRALLPKDDDWMRTEGWLELDNGFMFFTSEQMWRATAELFGVDVDE